LTLLAQTAIISIMNSRHRKTIEAIFAKPTTGTIEWASIEALLIAAGCAVIEGSGSSVTFEKDGKRAYFHRLHPGKEALRYRVYCRRSENQQFSAVQKPAGGEGARNYIVR